MSVDPAVSPADAIPASKQSWRERRALRAAMALGSMLAFGVAVWGLSRSLDWREAWRAMRSANGSLLIASAAGNMLSVLLAGISWRVLLPGTDRRLLGIAVRATWVGVAVSALMPANTGAVVRIAILAKEADLASAVATSALVVQRSIEAGTAVLFFLLVSPFLHHALSVRLPLRSVIIGLVVTGLAMAIMRGPSRLRRWVGRTRLGSWMREGWVSARTTATPRRLGIAFALGLISWGGQLLSYHFCARAVGLQIPIGDSVLVLAATNLSFVVRVTPGNVGVFQIVFVATAAMLGMPRETAAAAAVVLQALEMVPVLLVAGLIVAPGVWRARRPRLA